MVQRRRQRGLSATSLLLIALFGLGGCFKSGSTLTAYYLPRDAKPEVAASALECVAQCGRDHPAGAGRIACAESCPGLEAQEDETCSELRRSGARFCVETRREQRGIDPLATTVFITFGALLVILLGVQALESAGHK